MAKKPNPFANMKSPFERSKTDKDKGMKEGSKGEMARDKKQFPAFLKKKGK